jgi:hypothetical protein
MLLSPLEVKYGESKYFQHPVTIIFLLHSNLLYYYISINNTYLYHCNTRKLHTLSILVLSFKVI